MLGIGVVTYNRLAGLQKTLGYLGLYTKNPCVVIVADDGSTDGTAEWCRANKWPVITGANRGVAWNKNRALYGLMHHSTVDQLLLLEDDGWPVEAGWDRLWEEAGRRWDHVNWCYHSWSVPEDLYAGKGTPESPYASKHLTGVCTVSSRKAVEKVGYFDSRFRGYGGGHAEWTARFAKAGFVAAKQHYCMRGGVVHLNAASHRPAQEVIERNERLKNQLIAAPFAYQHPWANTLDRDTFLAEQKETWAS